MRPSIHTITIDADFIEDEGPAPEIDVKFRYTPGRPAYTPRGEYGPIDPPEPPEVEILSASMVRAYGREFSDETVREIAQEWLEKRGGFDAAIRYARRW